MNMVMDQLKLPQFLEDKVNYFAVARLEEAIELRENEIKLPNIMLGIYSLRFFRNGTKN